MAVVVSFAAAGCGGKDEAARGDDGTVTGPGTASVFELQPGDCLMPDPAMTGEIDTIPVVPCSEPHTQEVFGTVEHPEDAFPGAGALAQFADTACLGKLQTDLGASPSDGFFISYLLPSFDSWNKEDDRGITCVLVFPTTDGVTGSIVADRRRAEAEAAASGTTTSVFAAG